MDTQAVLTPFWESTRTAYVCSLMEFWSPWDRHQGQGMPHAQLYIWFFSP